MASSRTISPLLDPGVSEGDDHGGLCCQARVSGSCCLYCHQNRTSFFSHINMICKCTLIEARRFGSTFPAKTNEPLLAAPSFSRFAIWLAPPSTTQKNICKIKVYSCQRTVRMKRRRAWPRLRLAALRRNQPRPRPRYRAAATARRATVSRDTANAFIMGGFVASSADVSTAETSPRQQVPTGRHSPLALARSSSLS
jgi:hypothetical protein